MVMLQQRVGPLYHYYAAVPKQQNIGPHEYYGLDEASAPLHTAEAPGVSHSLEYDTHSCNK